MTASFDVRGEDLHHGHGLHTIKVLIVFRLATGASLADLKAFGAWWDHTVGVTDAPAFDAWAARVFE